ncbi:unnamed protein product [Penicillium roqueforti FM164]|uniref:Genomic scaffold, ProqFM164S02 n=1 Tax=Penicillium roqueforti (strain FM164) TaxID=1365484 RepID=W6QPB3_PENRF|nr:unnamed protein product [Penicillium roqueforti FM164]
MLRFIRPISGPTRGFIAQPLACQIYSRPLVRECLDLPSVDIVGLSGLSAPNL